VIGLQRLFRFFEGRIGNSTAAPPPEVERSGPPPGLAAFYWHFVRQTRGLYVAMLATGLGMALIDTLVPVFIGRRSA
jgi:ATP-binding cassette subfamily B multidrug efflux pump